MIATEPTPASDPGKAALDHPSSGQWPKAGRKELLPVHFRPFGDEQAALGNGERAHDLYAPAHLFFEPFNQSASIMAIPPQQLHLGKLIFDLQQQGFGSRQIGAGGSKHFDGEQMALRINEQVPLAPPDFFSPHRSPFLDHEPHWF